MSDCPLQTLLALDLDDLVVERAVLDLMVNARHITEIQFVNGLKPGQLTAALDGQPVGTVVYRADAASGGGDGGARERRRAHVRSPLMRESLVDKKVIAGAESPVTAILPDVNVIQIGGRSIMDRGRSALLPLLDEIVANRAEHTQLIGVGAGVRSRHIFSVGLDLGLPTGVLATLSAKDAAQNA